MWSNSNGVAGGGARFEVWLPALRGGDGRAIREPHAGPDPAPGEEPSGSHHELSGTDEDAEVGQDRAAS